MDTFPISLLMRTAMIKAEGNVHQVGASIPLFVWDENVPTKATRSAEGQRLQG